ncbi:MAG: FtsX-like permease family protein [Christensenella sp.]|nr:FtsX-like permease family protein [Christensenella sp.]
MSEISNSIRQILRTPLRSGLFLVLVSLSASLLTLGVALYMIGEANIKRLEEVFVTIGLVSQTPDRHETVSYWDAEKKKYTSYSASVYDKYIAPDVLFFDGADYIIPPKHRAYYGAYDPNLKYPDNSYIRLIAQTRTRYPIVVVTPIEDCVPDHPVPLKLLRELYGIQGIAGRKIGDWETVLFCDHDNPAPSTLYAGKTYVMALELRPSHREWMETHTGVDALFGEYAPRSYHNSYVVSTQYTPEGVLIPDEKPLDNGYQEVMVDFFESPDGQRWLELAKSMDMAEHTYPVIPTDNTQLLMSFYVGNSSIVDGRDISAEEYQQGQTVCLISQQFAELNGYAVGDTLPVSLYYADYYDSASRDFPPDGLPVGNPNHLLNAQGKCYDIFDQDNYTIVGIYNEINQVSYSEGYDMAGYGVVVPAASVKNSDANNILDYGPMKGFNTVFQIPNGSVERYLEKWNAIAGTGDGDGIGSHIEISIYDKGYTQIKEGLSQINQVAVALLVSGLLVTILILLFFCNLFIGKQKRRTAIERSLGMGKRSCTISLLAGVLAIVTTGSIVGSGAGYALSGAVMGLLGALSKSVSFSTEYSNWAQATSDVEQMNLVTGMVAPLVPLICFASVVLLALGISLVQIRGNLRSEPLKLLSTPKS